MKPFIRTKKIKRSSYYYLVEPIKEGGRWKQRQTYLGTPQSLLAKLSQAQAPLDVSFRSFGDVAALFLQAQELHLADTIDRHLPLHRESLPVGQLLVLAAINRCCAPTSKAGISSWYRKTVLPDLMGLEAEKLTSQAFWEAMDWLSETTISQIEEDLWHQLFQSYQLPLDVLLYDTTNFFTFLQEQTRSELAQRGHNKAGRDNLRQVGLALAVTRNLGFPLLHQVYCGSTHDAKLFPKVIPVLIDRWLKLSRGAGKVTLVFDKGSNSHPNLRLLENRPEVSFIGSLVPSHHKDLLRVDLSQYQDLPLPAESGEEEPLKAYRTQKEVFGANRTVVVTYNAALYRKQLYSQERRLEKAKAALEEVNWAKVKTPSQKVQLLLAKYHVQGLLKVTLPPKPHHKVRTAKVWYRIYRQRRLFFGKLILFTDREEIETSEIVSLYRGKNTVEDCFKRMHDPTSISFTPMYHWTDQKIRVHAFICVLGLLLLRLLEFKASLDKKTLMSIPALLEELSDIKEAIVLQGDMSTSRMISHCSSVQKKLAQTYGLERVAEPLGIKHSFS